MRHRRRANKRPLLLLAFPALQLCHPLIPFDFAAMGEWLNSAFILRARATGLELKGQVVRVPLGPAHLQQHQQQQEQAPSSPASASAAATQHTGPSGPLQSGAQEEPRGSGSLPAAGSCPFASTLGSLQRPARASSPREGHGDGNSRLNSPGADSAAVGGRVCDGGGCSGDGAPPVGLLFMGSVRLEGLEAMRQAGLYVSDIPLHDLNRDFVLAAAQVAAEAQLRERYEALSLELQVRACVVVHSPLALCACVSQLPGRCVRDCKFRVAPWAMRGKNRSVCLKRTT